MVKINHASFIEKINAVKIPKQYADLELIYHIHSVNFLDSIEVLDSTNGLVLINITRNVNTSAYLDIYLTKEDVNSILKFNKLYPIESISYNSDHILCKSIKNSLKVQCINLPNFATQNRLTMSGNSIIVPKNNTFNNIAHLEEGSKDQLICLDCANQSLLTFNKSGSEIIRYTFSDLISGNIKLILFLEDFKDILNLINNNQSNHIHVFNNKMNFNTIFNDFNIYYNLRLPANQSNTMFDKAKNLLDNLSLAHKFEINSNDFIETINAIFQYTSLEDSVSVTLNNNDLEFYNKKYKFVLTKFTKSFTNGVIDFGISIRNLRNILKLIKKHSAQTFELYIGDSKRPILYLKIDNIEILIGLEKNINLIRRIDIS